MLSPSNEEVKKLVEDMVLAFYQIDRDMTVPSPSGYRQENDAEHSWSVALVACTLAPHIDPSLDIGLVSQFAIVHDLVEVYASDVSVWADDETLSNKESRESEALEKIKITYNHFPWLVETIDLYEKQNTQEALYVRSIDKYLALVIRFLEGGNFFKQSGITKEFFDKNLQTHRQKAHLHKGASKYYEAMRKEFDEHPEHFANKSSKVIIVAGCLIEKDGKFLLVQEKKPSAYGLWNLPAGHVDEGEDVEHAAIRETREETGLDVEVMRKSGVYPSPSGSHTIHVYIAKSASTEINFPKDEILNASWLTYEDVKTLDSQGKTRAPFVIQCIEEYLENET